MTITEDRLTASASPALACPTWCARPTGHGPEFVDADESGLIVHRAVLLADSPEGCRLDLLATSYVTSDGGIEHDPAVVTLDGAPDRVLTAAQARRQAAALLHAADLIDASAAAAGGVQ